MQRRELIGFGIAAAIMALALAGGILLTRQARARMFPNGATAKPATALTGPRWDPLGDLDARVDAIPEDQRAWPLLADAGARLQGEARTINFTLRPGQPGWSDLALWLEGPTAAGAIEAFERAAARPHLGRRLAPEDDTIWRKALARHGADIGPHTPDGIDQPLISNTPLPEVGAVARGMHMLLADARLASTLGDRDRFRRDVVLAVRLTPYLAESGFMICQTAASWRLAETAELVAQILTRQPDLLDEPTSAAVESSLAHAAAACDLATGFAREQVVVEDALRRLVDEDGVFVLTGGRTEAVLAAMNGDYQPPPPSSAPWDRVDPDLRDALARSAAYLAAVEASARVPWAPVPPETHAVWWSWLASTPESVPSDSARRVFMAGFGKTFDVAVVRTQRQNLLGIRLALAAHRHRLRHGIPPPSIDAVDPDLLAFNPVDGFTGDPLQYRWTNGGPLVYALGADLDDDSGRPVKTPDGAPPTISGAYLSEGWDGDWVIFPPDFPTTGQDG